MSKAYKCDRCGAVFSKRDGYFGKGGIYADPLKLEYHVIGEKYADYKRQLCPECCARCYELISGSELLSKEESE